MIGSMVVGSYGNIEVVIESLYLLIRGRKRELIWNGVSFRNFKVRFNEFMGIIYLYYYIDF